MAENLPDTNVGNIEYISKQDAIEEIRKAENHAFNSFYKGLVKAHKIVADLPSADVVPVVRCHYCQYYDTDINYCHTHNSYDMEQDDFCSYGDRKE